VHDAPGKREKISPGSGIGSSGPAEKESATGRIVQVVVVESSVIEVDASPCSAAPSDSTSSELRQGGGICLNDYSAGPVIGGDSKNRAIIGVHNRSIQDRRVVGAGKSNVQRSNCSGCVGIHGP